MFLRYLEEVFRRVFVPTTNRADLLSVLVPMALAAWPFVSGRQLSSDLETNWLAYVGIVTLGLFAFRLLVTAPYSLWKERVEEISRLETELAKPQRLLLENISREQARIRLKVSELVHEMWTWGFGPPSDRVNVTKTISNLAHEISQNAAQASLGASFERGRHALIRLAVARVDGFKGPDDEKLARALMEFANATIDEAELKTRTDEAIKLARDYDDMRLGEAAIETS